MLSILQWDNLIPNIHYTLLTYWNYLHTQAANIFASPSIHIPEATQCAIWLRGVHFSRSWVNIWEFAARSPAGDGELVGSDPDLLPGIFFVRFWSGNWHIN